MSDLFFLFIYLFENNILLTVYDEFLTDLLMIFRISM